MSRGLRPGQIKSDVRTAKEKYRQESGHLGGVSIRKRRLPPREEEESRASTLHVPPTPKTRLSKPTEETQKKETKLGTWWHTPVIQACEPPGS